VSITLVHHFHPQVGAVEHICKYSDLESITDWLKLKPFRLKAMVLMPSDVNQIPITGHAAKKKCNARLLSNEAYWNQPPK